MSGFIDQLKYETLFVVLNLVYIHHPRAHHVNSYIELDDFIAEHLADFFSDLQT